MTENSRFYLWTVALILVWLAIVQLQVASAESNNSTVITTGSPNAVDTTSSPRKVNPLTEAKHERNCKALCEHCGCLGFYCGEECLCECNDDNSDTECIRTMQVNAKLMNSPFDILIQGPSSNRFVRNAQQFEQKHEMVARSASSSSQLPRNRRSNITIYKPAKKGSSQSTPNALETVSKASEVDHARNKRSVEHLEWFNDFAGSLVRPSPLGTRAQRQSKPVGFKRQTVVEEPTPLIRREPWFLEQSVPRMIRPAPLNKKQSYPKNRKSSSSRRISKSQISKKQTREEPEREIRPLRDALQVVERIPRVLQDTVNHLAADTPAGDIFSLNIMNEALPRESDDEERPPRRPKSSSRDSRRNEIVPEAVTLAAPAALAPAQLGLASAVQPGGLFPWLRQQRLRRLQQARRNI